MTATWTKTTRGTWERRDRSAMGRIHASGAWDVFVMGGNKHGLVKVDAGTRDTIIAASIAADLAMAAINEQREAA